MYIVLDHEGQPVGEPEWSSYMSILYYSIIAVMVVEAQVLTTDDDRYADAMVDVDRR